MHAFAEGRTDSRSEAYFRGDTGGRLFLHMQARLLESGDTTCHYPRCQGIQYCNGLYEGIFAVAGREDEGERAFFFCWEK